MKLIDFVKLVELRFPLKFAASWDNVGLLVNPGNNMEVRKVMLTNDFTLSVVNEAIFKKAQLIICYHPVIFSPLKSIEMLGTDKNSSVLKAFKNDVAVYSQHTVVDSINGGVNDWLVSLFDNFEPYSIQIIESNTYPKTWYPFSFNYKSLTSSMLDRITKQSSIQFFLPYDKFNTLHDSKLQKNIFTDSKDISSIFQDPGEFGLVKEKTSLPDFGHGRKFLLKKQVSLKDCIYMIKSKLNMKNLNVAPACFTKPEDFSSLKIQSVALNAGAGDSILRKAGKVDLIVTGEMPHHSLLSYVETGTSVILCNHSNSERGYHSKYLQQLDYLLDIFQITDPETRPTFFLSECDQDPMIVV